MEGIKPGWSRVNFNYFISEEVFEFIIEAVHLVANEGWRLLADYRFCPKTGQWTHRDGRPDPGMRLSELRYRSGRLLYSSRHITAPEWTLPHYIDEGARIMKAGARGQQQTLLDHGLPEDFEELRWFPLPGETA